MMITKEITDRTAAMNVLYGIDDGSLNGKLVKLIIEIDESDAENF
jgi:hypothetical protein